MAAAHTGNPRVLTASRARAAIQNIKDQVRVSSTKKKIESQIKSVHPKSKMSYIRLFTGLSALVSVICTCLPVPSQGELLRAVLLSGIACAVTC